MTQEITNSDQILAELEAVRASRTACLEERRVVATAPVPLAEASERVEALIDKLADDAPYSWGRFFQLEVPAPPHRTPQVLPTSVDWRSPPAMQVFTTDEHERFFLGLFRDLVKKFVAKAMKANQPAAKAIPSADRPKLLAALDRRRRELEMEEERLVMRAELAGIAGVFRRGDADPAIVLETTLDDAA